MSLIATSTFEHGVKRAVDSAHTAVTNLLVEAVATA